MHDLRQIMPGLRPKPVLVLGTDAVASAVGHALASVGIMALLVRDPDVPVLHRGMSFDDALEQGFVRVEGVTAYAAHDPLRISLDAFLNVTALPVDDLMSGALIAGVIDARMRRLPHNPDLRGGLRFAIGLGPGFTAGANVDIAVESASSPRGTPGRAGTTLPAHRTPRTGGAGERRLVQAPRAGIWWTFREIGETVEDGAVVGLCGGMQVAAPVAGYLRGLVRRGTEMSVGMRLLEVDPQRQNVQCYGLCPHAAKIAAACLGALHEIWRSPRPARCQEVATWLA
jgi:xanthine dehydrogenase accessory factor